MSQITTALTKLLKIRVPLVCPPMAGVAGGHLAAAVHRAGGFGFIAAGHTPLSSLTTEIKKSREALQLAEDDPLPVGIGLITWRLESPHGDPSQAPAFFETILDARPAAIWLSFGADLKKWVNKVRKLEKEKQRERTPLFVMVGSVQSAIDASEWDVDVVVAQGNESGGHGPSAGLPLLSLLAALHPTFSTRAAPLLLGAGGITTGSQLVSILPHCPGAVMGTAFLATPESLYSEAQKDLIVRSSGEHTVRTEAFDLARGTLGWGSEVDGRGLRNKTTDEDRLDEVGTEEGRARYNAAAKAGDLSRIVTWSGTSVGLVKDKAPAEEVVRRVEGEALASMASLKRLLT